MLRGGSWQLGEKGTHYVKTIKNSSHHLANIINDILDAAAFSKGRLVIKREKASAHVALHPAIHAAGSPLLKAHCTCALSDPIGYTLRCDCDRRFTKKV